MTFAFGHIVGGWLFGRFIELISKRKILQWEWAFLLFGALLPDIDFVLGWVFGLKTHRTFTHSIIFVIICFIALFLTGKFLMQTRLKNAFGLANKKVTLHGITLCIGIVSHLILDMMLGKPGIALLWPLDYGLWFFGITPFNIHGVLYGTKEALIAKIRFMIGEMFVGVAWLGWIILTNRMNLALKPQIKFK